MILNLIIQALLMFVNLVVSLIPEIDFSFDISGYIGAVANIFGYVDSFISIQSILFCVTATLVVDNFSFIVKIFTFIWSKIPFIN